MRASQIHYDNGKGYDLIDVAKDFDLNFNMGNVLKYICRAGKKYDNSELQDLKKAMDYLQREIDYLIEEREIKNEELLS